MLQNAYSITKVDAGTAENERIFNFCENLPNIGDTLGVQPGAGGPEGAGPRAAARRMKRSV